MRIESNHALPLVYNRQRFKKRPRKMRIESYRPPVIVLDEHRGFKKRPRKMRIERHSWQPLQALLSKFQEASS